MINVTIWNEFAETCHSDEAIKNYPYGHHVVIRDFLNKCGDINATAVTLFDKDQGLPDELLNNTDVLIWWGHCRHNDVSDELVDKIIDRVHSGMGLILLHSAHLSKVFRRVIGSSGKLCWSSFGEREHLWVSALNHPITKGIGDCIVLDEEEMYGEPFDVPAPDEVIFNCWYSGGRVFRGGLTWHRGAGRIFYFQPGHETYPTYYNKEIQKVLINAVRWAYNKDKVAVIGCPCVLPVVDPVSFKIIKNKEQ